MKPYTSQLSMQAVKGFTLVEMAVVLAIVALLLAGLLPTISSQLEQSRRNETRKQLDEIQQALLGFAITRGYLPCPAKSSTDGTEDRTAGSCTGAKRVGFLPWTELGVSKSDSWGRLYTYSVTPSFSNSATPFALNSCSPGCDITIRSRDSSGTLINLTNANSIPVVVMSHGPNGLFATAENGNVISSGAASSNNVDDQKNNAPTPNGTGTGVIFVSREPAAPANSTDEPFDDIVISISPNILFNRMVTAGKLP